MFPQVHRILESMDKFYGLRSLLKDLIMSSRHLMNYISKSKCLRLDMSTTITQTVESGEEEYSIIKKQHYSQVTKYKLCP